MLMVPFRERVAELQSRIAFIAASAFRGTQPVPRSEVDANYLKAREDIHRLLDEIDREMTGPSLGPADDCRRALQTLLRRLP